MYYHTEATSVVTQKRQESEAYVIQVRSVDGGDQWVLAIRDLHEPDS